MGKCWSKVLGETKEQTLWLDICAKKTPSADETQQLPHVPDLHINAYGMSGIALVPDPAWPEKYEVKFQKERKTNHGSFNKHNPI